MELLDITAVAAEVLALVLTLVTLLLLIFPPPLYEEFEGPEPELEPPFTSN